MTKWIEDNHMADYIVVIYDPLSHIELLRSMHIEVDETKLYSSKVMISFFISLEDSMLLFEEFTKEEGPFVQLWALGCLVRENY